MAPQAQCISAVEIIGIQPVSTLFAIILSRGVIEPDCTGLQAGTAIAATKVGAFVVRYFVTNGSATSKNVLWWSAQAGQVWLLVVLIIVYKVDGWPATAI